MESLIQESVPDLDTCILEYITGMLGDETTVEELSS